MTHMKLAVAAAVLALSGTATAQVALPALHISVVGDSLPLLGTLGLDGLVVGGPNLISLPPLAPSGNGSGVPSLTVSILGTDLPIVGDLGFQDLVLGGANGLQVPLLSLPALPTGPILDGLGENLPLADLLGALGVNGRLPIVSGLPGLDALPIRLDIILGLLDPSIVGDLLAGQPISNPALNDLLAATGLQEIVGLLNPGALLAVLSSEGWFGSSSGGGRLLGLEDGWSPSPDALIALHDPMLLRELLAVLSPP